MSNAPQQSIWTFVNTLYWFLSLAAVLFLFAYAWNFSETIQRRRLNRIWRETSLSDIEERDTYDFWYGWPSRQG